MVTAQGPQVLQHLCPQIHPHCLSQIALLYQILLFWNQFTQRLPIHLNSNNRRHIFHCLLRHPLQLYRRSRTSYFHCLHQVIYLRQSFPFRRLEVVRKIMSSELTFQMNSRAFRVHIFLAAPRILNKAPPLFKRSELVHMFLSLLSTLERVPACLKKHKQLEMCIPFLRLTYGFQNWWPPAILRFASQCFPGCGITSLASKRGFSLSSRTRIRQRNQDAARQVDELDRIKKPGFITMSSRKRWITRPKYRLLLVNWTLKEEPATPPSGVSFVIHSSLLRRIICSVSSFGSQKFTDGIFLDHYRSHLKMDEYICPGCNKAFRTESISTRHKRYCRKISDSTGIKGKGRLNFPSHWQRWFLFPRSDLCIPIS